MDAPEIRYARAGDGVSIAYRTLGQGTPVLLPSWPLLYTFDGEWQVPEARVYYQHLAAGRKLIPVDARGSGMSAGEKSWVPETTAGDLLAVADHLAIHRFAMISNSSVMPALELERASPGRLTRAAVFTPIVDVQSHVETSMSSGFQQFGIRDGEAYARLQAEFSGLKGEESRSLFVRMVADAMDPSDYADMLDVWTQWSQRARELMPTFQPHMLAVHHRSGIISAEQSRMLVSGVQNGRLHLLDGEGLAPFGGDWMAVATAIERFLDEEEVQAEAETPDGALQILMFTDLESSTALTQRVGDAAAQEVLHGHNDAVRKSLEEHGGREVKHTGDGIMAAFPSAVRAVEAAVQIQHDLAGGEVRVRIGLNAGEPIAEDDDFFGTAVQLAARICDRAEPGQVLVSRVVADLCAGKRLSFESTGEAHMKGFDEPVALFEVGG